MKVSIRENFLKNWKAKMYNNQNEKLIRIQRHIWASSSNQWTWRQDNGSDQIQGKERKTTEKKSKQSLRELGDTIT